MPRYMVKGNAEEFDCPECGAPVYSGESAYEDVKSGSCFCSVLCCAKREQRKGATKVIEFVGRGEWAD